MRKVVGYVGREGEFAFYDKEQKDYVDAGRPENDGGWEDWLPTGGRRYVDNDGTPEYCTRLIEIAPFGKYDPSVELWNAALADNARAMRDYKGQVYGLSNHINVSGNAKAWIEPLLQTIGPALLYLGGRQASEVMFRNYKDGRVEVCTPFQITEASVRGLGALLIAAITALENNEVDMEKFPYKVEDPIKDVDCEYLTLDIYKKLTKRGKRAKIKTSNGEKTIKQNLEDAVKFFEEAIKKYCSEGTFKFLVGIARGVNKTDLDYELEGEGDYTLFEEDHDIEAILQNEFGDLLLTEEYFTNYCGRTSRQILQRDKPKGVAKIFARAAREREDDPLVARDIGWDTITYCLHNEVLLHIAREELTSFHDLISKFKDDKKILLFLRSFYEQGKEDKERLRDVLYLLASEQSLTDNYLPKFLKKIKGETSLLLRSSLMNEHYQLTEMGLTVAKLLLPDTERPILNEFRDYKKLEELTDGLVGMTIDDILVKVKSMQLDDPTKVYTSLIFKLVKDVTSLEDLDKIEKFAEETTIMCLSQNKSLNILYKNVNSLVSSRMFYRLEQTEQLKRLLNETTGVNGSKCDLCQALSHLMIEANLLEGRLCSRFRCDGVVKGVIDLVKKSMFSTIGGEIIAARQMLQQKKDTPDSTTKIDFENLYKGIEHTITTNQSEVGSENFISYGNTPIMYRRIREN